MQTQHDNAESTTWQAYRNALYHFVLSRVEDQSAAEDIVQDVLLKAFARRQTLREPSKLRAWLYQITRNQIIDYYRSQKPSVPVPDELIQQDDQDDDSHVLRELARCLVPLLDHVPEPYRQALRLADVEGIKQRAIASRLGLSLSGAKSRVQRGRKMLKDVLLTCCRVELDRKGRLVDYDVGEGCDDCSTPSNK